MNNQVFGVFSCFDPTCEEYTLEQLFFNEQDANQLAQQIQQETITIQDEVMPKYSVEIRKLSIQ